MGRTPISRERAFGQTLVQLARSLANGYDVVELFDGLVSSCADLLDAAAVGLLLADRQGQLQIMAASSEDSRTLEQFELQNGEGPCLDCFRTRDVVSSIDPGDQAARWPTFGPEIRSRGLGAVYALPMQLGELTIGALNLYRPPGSPLGEDDLYVAQALADIATVTLVQHRTIQAGEVLAEQLQTALTSRIVIEQAKGVISAHAKIDMDDAFELLRGHARRTQSRLAEVAAAVAAGRLPPDELRPAKRHARTSGPPA